MPKTRSLRDLFVRGKEVLIDDGYGEPVQVYVQKLNPIERETATRLADAARAKTIAGKNHPESDIYLNAWSDAEALPRPTKILMLVNAEARNILEMVKDEIAAADEWSNDDYLQGLQDAWRNGLSQKFKDDPEDPEAKRVNDELQRYLDLVRNAMKEKLDDHKAELSNLTNTDLEDAVVNLSFQMRGQNAWITEFQRAQAWLATRVCEGVIKNGTWDHSACNHRELAIPEFADLGQLQDEAIAQLIRAVDALTVDPLEGKDSPVTPAS